MDFSIISGLGLGFAVLILALFLGHVPPQTLLNPEALLVVFGGTMAATLVSFKQGAVWRAFKALSPSSVEGAVELSALVSYVLDVVAFVRDEGILALQNMVDGIELPFFRKGLGLVLDNRSEKFIRESLSTEIEVIHREQLEHARVFETAGGFAPTMGIIGAVIGLITALQAFQDPSQLAKGVAGAFSATLFGVALANLFLLPLAARLRQQARSEYVIRTLLLEAILAIRAGEHPLLIEERLNAFTAGADSEQLPTAAKPYATHQSILPPGAVMNDDFLQIQHPVGLHE